MAKRGKGGNKRKRSKYEPSSNQGNYPDGKISSDKKYADEKGYVPSGGSTFQQIYNLVKWLNGDGGTVRVNRLEEEVLKYRIAPNSGRAGRAINNFCRQPYVQRQGKKLKLVGAYSE